MISKNAFWGIVGLKIVKRLDSHAQLHIQLFIISSKQLIPRKNMSGASKYKWNSTAIDILYHHHQFHGQHSNSYDIKIKIYNNFTLTLTFVSSKNTFFVNSTVLAKSIGLKNKYLCRCRTSKNNVVKVISDTKWNHYQKILFWYFWDKQKQPFINV